MASTTNALLCAAFALALWGVLGLPLMLRVAPRPLAMFIAPIAGWAIHSVVVLPIFFVIGLTKTSVWAIAVISILAALLSLYSARSLLKERNSINWLTICALVLAAILAFLIMSAVLPKAMLDGVALPHPIFDHSKVAMIDEMTRLRVPPGNPFFGEVGGFSRLSYYYLWHFSAAEIALMLGVSGWEADAGLTYFTAFSSLLLMMGFATHFSGRASGALWAVVVAATASARTVLTTVFGYSTVAALAGWPTGWGGWLFQVNWAPQHVASATCVVLAIFMLVQLAQRPTVMVSALFGILAAASFETSTWIGGITFPLAAAAAVFVIIFRMPPENRTRFIMYAAGAAMIALLFASPMISDQARATALRAAGSPIAIGPYPVLEDQFPDWFRTVFDWPAFWLIFLPVEFPVFYPAGIAAFYFFIKRKALDPDRIPLALAFAALTLASMFVGWQLTSIVGANNDLAWRGVLPAIMVLIVVSSSAFAMFWQTMKRPLKAIAAMLLIMSLIEGAKLMRENYVIEPAQTSGRAFVDSVAMWEAVRRHSGPTNRIANSQFFVRDMTSWPINISWALLSNRRSCYAGSDLVLPFAPLTRERRDEIDAKFTRVFDGAATPGDLTQLASTYKCDLIVITSQDGAWTTDQIAKSGLYRLVEEDAALWRIYQINR